MSTLQLDERRARIEKGGTTAINPGNLFAREANSIPALHVLVGFAAARSNGEVPVLYEPLRIGGGAVRRIGFEEADLSRQVRQMRPSEPRARCAKILNAARIAPPLFIKK